MSGPSKVEEQEAVVWVRRSDWERVTEREELVGRLREGSRLPQYLESFCQCCSRVARKVGVLDHCDVHRSGRARAVDLLVGHVVRTNLVSRWSPSKVRHLI